MDFGLCLGLGIGLLLHSQDSTGGRSPIGTSKIVSLFWTFNQYKRMHC